MKLSDSQGDVASSADRPEGADSDHDDDPAGQGARPDLTLAAAVLLPAPVPIPMPEIEHGKITGSDLGMGEAEFSNAGDGASKSNPIVAGVLAAATSPLTQALDVEFAGAIRVPDAAEPTSRRPSSAQSLAFALRLTGTDKSVKIELSALRAGPRVAEDSGISEPAKDLAEPNQPETSLPAGEVTRSGSRTSGALARSIVGNIPTASLQTVSRNAGTETADAATGSSKSATRTNSDQEAGSRPAKVRAADETGAARRESEQTAAPVRSTAAPLAATISSVPTPPAGVASRPPQTGPSDAAATRTQRAEHIDTALGEKTASRTARDILVQIPVQDGRKVEVQVAERTGEVRVAVRTADPELNQSLRVELGSLVSRLETAGYKADSFAPSESFISSSSSSSSRQDPSSQQQDASRGFSGQGQGSSGQGGSQERHQEKETMPWAEQFASHLSPNGESGKESQLWQSIFSR